MVKSYRNPFISNDEGIPLWKIIFFIITGPPRLFIITIIAIIGSILCRISNKCSSIFLKKLLEDIV